MSQEQAAEMNWEEAFGEMYFTNCVPILMGMGKDRLPVRISIGNGKQVLLSLSQEHAKLFHHVLLIPEAFAATFDGVIDQILCLPNVEIITEVPRFAAYSSQKLDLHDSWSYGKDGGLWYFRYTGKDEDGDDCSSSLVVIEGLEENLPEDMDFLVYCQEKQIPKDLVDDDVLEYMADFVGPEITKYLVLGDYVPFKESLN